MATPHGPTRRLPCAPAKLALAVSLALAGACGWPAQAATPPDPPRGPYFGQSPPTTVPSVFAPGIVSLGDRYEYVIAFSPDGTECVFGVTDPEWSTCDLYYSKQVGGVWSRPAKAAFQGTGDGWLPFFAPDGKRLLFSSGRPDIMKGSNAWISERTPAGWGPPVMLEPPVNSPAYDWRPTVTAGGVLYFSSNREGSLGDQDIYRSAPGKGGQRTIEHIGPPVSSPQNDASPYPSPDERFLTLESWRPGGHGQGDLYIAYRRPDGSWTEPQNLGPEINTDQIEDGGSISPDGKYFFFNRRKAWVTKEQTDIHWVDIRAILRPYVLDPAGEVDAFIGRKLTVSLRADEFADQDDRKLRYSASLKGGAPLPGWLVFDPESRTLTGTPPAAGTIVVVITATDAVGSATSDSLRIEVAGPPGSDSRDSGAPPAR